MKHLLPTIALFAFSLNASAQNVIANFSVATGSSPTGCLPLTVAFTDQSTGNPTSWLWDFGNSNTSTLQNPSATYTNPGTYTVKLTVANATSADSITRIDYITVFAKPVAGFVISNNPVCQFDQVIFSDSTVLGSAPIASWYWSFGDGNAQLTTQSSISHNYQLPGTLPITLTITDTNGCTSADNATITVIPRPTIVFSAIPVTSCSAPVNVTFTNSTTTSQPPTYQWNFGDGSFSTSINPTHTYLNQGSYTVTLTVTQGGCVDSLVMTNYINVFVPQASFTVSDSTPCANDPTIAFTNTSVPATASAFWTFGDGGTSNAFNPTHAFTQTGLLTVTLVATDVNGCLDSVSHIYNVLPTPYIVFSANDSTKCSVPATVLFSANSAGATTWSWSFGDGGNSTQQNPSHIYTSTGSFPVTVQATNASGCSATVSGIIIAVDTIDINFYVSPQPAMGCAPLSVTFLDSSFCSTDPIVSYTYNFGDGQSSTSSNPVTTHTYASVGTYNVTYTVTTAEGCTKTIIKNAIVIVSNPPSPVNFTSVPDTICHGGSITLTNLSQGWDVSYWYSSGGGSVTQTDTLDPDVTMIFAADTGTFSVTLIACNNMCCDTLILDSIVTVHPPRPLFNTVYNCSNPLSVSFTNMSAGADSVIWYFGDGAVNTANVSALSHTYAATGNYTVTLIAFNYQYGCIDSIKQTVNVTIPVAGFTATPLVGCYPLKVNFNASSSQNANQYKWNFGNGTITAFKSSPLDSIFYYLPGYYDITLVVQDIHGCNDTLVMNDYIHAYGPRMYYYANPLAGCAPFTTTFVDTTQDEFPVITWDWTFGDGSPTQSTSVPNVTHTYNNPGTYTVQLHVVDSMGCQLTLQKAAYIFVSQPKPSFTLPAAACKGQLITIDGSATVSTPNSNFNWNFGDGQSVSGTASTVTHAYTTDGTFTVSLTVTDSVGCDSTLTHTISISSPDAGFFTDTTQTCGLTVAVFHPNDSVTAGLTYQWFISNGASSVLQNPQFNFTVPGYYGATLVVANPTGCSDTLTLDSIIVVAGPYSTFTFSPQNGCAPLTVNFTATGTGVQYYIWDFGDGNIDSTTVPYITHTYTSDLTALPNMTVVANNNGTFCDFGTVNQTGYINVQSLTSVSIIANGSSQSSVTVGSGQSVNLSAVQAPNVNVNYSWQGNGLNCTTCQNPVLTPTGSGYVIVTATQVNGGCFASDTLYIDYLPCQGKALNILDNNQNVIDSVVLGIGQQVQLSVSTVGNITSYQWSPSSGLSCTTCSSPLLTGTGVTLYYTLTTQDLDGCTLYDSVKVIYVACSGFESEITDSDGNAFDTLTIMQGQQVQIDVNTIAGNNLIYTWNPSTGLSCTDCQNPVITGSGQNITYIVTVDGAGGCRTTDSIEITGISCVDVYDLPNVFTPNGDNLNDLFYIKSACAADDYLLIIYNRWGNELFRSAKPEEGWNGKSKAGDVSEGTYYYILTAKGTTTHGSFMLIRN